MTGAEKGSRSKVIRLWRIFVCSREEGIDIYILMTGKWRSYGLVTGSSAREVYYAWAEDGKIKAEGNLFTTTLCSSGLSLSSGMNKKGNFSLPGKWCTWKKGVLPFTVCSFVCRVVFPRRIRLFFFFLSNHLVGRVERARKICAAQEVIQTPHVRTLGEILCVWVEKSCRLSGKSGLDSIGREEIKTE